jgi:hypothetical protein
MAGFFVNVLFVASGDVLGEEPQLRLMKKHFISALSNQSQASCSAVIPDSAKLKIHAASPCRLLNIHGTDVDTGAPDSVLRDGLSGEEFKTLFLPQNHPVV